MAKKTIFIAFARGGILPAAIIGEKKDIKVPAHTPVPVPADYGQHLIDDKFAYDATEMAEAIIEKRLAERKAAATAEEAKRKADAEAANQARLAAEKDAADQSRIAAEQKKASDIATAQKVIDDAKAKLAAAADDTAKADAQAELTKAEEALTALKA